MGESSLLVVMAGASPWIAWEFRQIVERGHARKLIVLFPQLRSRYRKGSAAGLAAIKEAFLGTPWESALREIDQPWRIRSLVFEKSGRVSLVVAKSRSRNAYHLATLIAHFLVDCDRVNQPHRTDSGPNQNWSPYNNTPINSLPWCAIARCASSLEPIRPLPPT